MKLGVITDGISRDFEHALKVMKEFDLEYAELQFIGNKEVGDMTDYQRARALALVNSEMKKKHGDMNANAAATTSGNTPVR